MQKYVKEQQMQQHMMRRGVCSTETQAFVDWRYVGRTNNAVHSSPEMVSLAWTGQRFQRSMK